MSVKDVETSLAYIDSCVHVMFCTSVFGRDRKNFFASVGDEGSLGTIIIYNMLRWEFGNRCSGNVPVEGCVVDQGVHRWGENCSCLTVDPRLGVWYLFEGACKVVSQGTQVEEVRTWVNIRQIRKESNNSVVTNNSVHS